MPRLMEDSSDEERDILDLKDDEGWDDVESDHEVTEVIHLFEDRKFSSLQAMLENCRDKHNFDLYSIQKDLRLDHIELIKLVNYVRGEVKANRRPGQIIGKASFNNDRHLQPVLLDDAVLYSLGDLIVEEDGDNDYAVEDSALEGVSLSEDTPAQLATSRKELAQAEQKVQELRRRLELTNMALQSTHTSNAVDESSDQIHKSIPSATEDLSCYAGIGIHREMLQDKNRTEAYRDFILGNKHLFRDKVVLDVGSGTGILSMFCAQAGAKQVYAVEKSSIYQKAQKIIYDNGFQDKIRILHGNVREISLPVAKVDIIVSEWMGYALLFEGMLDDILWARDRYLVPNGLMVPSLTTLRIAPFIDTKYMSDRIGFWKDVYGFNMSAMTDDEEVKHAEDCVLPSNSICGTSCTFRTISMYDATVESLSFSDASFSCTMNPSHSPIDGFAIWFDTYFHATPAQNSASQIPPTTLTKDAEGNVSFTTGPFGEATHWKQAILMLEERNKSSSLDESMVQGTVKYSKGKEHGSLDIGLSWSLQSLSRGKEREGKEVEGKDSGMHMQKWSLT